MSEFINANCGYCGASYGFLHSTEAILYCRDCVPRALANDFDSDKYPEHEVKPPLTHPMEHRAAQCGMCGKMLGHIRMKDSQIHNPAIFCGTSCLNDYRDAAHKDEKGTERAIEETPQRRGKRGKRDNDDESTGD